MGQFPIGRQGGSYLPQPRFWTAELVPGGKGCSRQLSGAQPAAGLPLTPEERGLAPRWLCSCSIPMSLPEKQAVTAGDASIEKFARYASRRCTICARGATHE